MAKQKKESIAERAKRIAGGGKPAVQKVEKLKKDMGGKTLGHKPLSSNGGAREGAGRKPLQFDEQRRTLKRSWENFAAEEDEIEIETADVDPITKERKKRKVKMQRLAIAQKALFENVKKGDTSAIREFNDRVIGKAKQPIVGDDDDAPLRVDLGVDRLLDKAYGEPQTDE